MKRGPCEEGLKWRHFEPLEVGIYVFAGYCALVLLLAIVSMGPRSLA
jgi:hypothetical protein